MIADYAMSYQLTLIGPAMINTFLPLFDRTMVLLLGTAMGALIGHAWIGESATASTPQRLQVAAPSNECSARVTPQLVSAMRAGRPLHIGVYGDSFGNGIWSGVYTQLRGDKSFVVHDFAKEGTGLTRYKKLNLLDVIRDDLRAQPVELAIVSIGANDTQGFWVDGKLAKFMDPLWQKTVGDRAVALAQTLKDQGAMVYWVGLPRMRDATLDDGVQQINQIFRVRMCAQGVRYVETLSATVDANGAYAPFLKLRKSGEQFRARANDGVHMTPQGYVELTRPLIDQIQIWSGAGQAG